MASAPPNTHVLIVGAGFAGLNCAKRLAADKRVSITLIDQRNHHLFQPLLYQVAMAGLSPADIATPIRSLLSHRKNVRVVCGAVDRIDGERNVASTSVGEIAFDYVVLACGAKHSYFGRDEWEPFAPGLKSLEQATEIRRRVLDAFEQAEVARDGETRRKLLTFVVVGGGPTGVELAGAIGEMSRFALAKDFRTINPGLARIILIEAGPRILSSFPESLSNRATRDLEKLGVQVWAESLVTEIDDEGVVVSGDRIHAATVLWAAGVQASSIGLRSGLQCDRVGRISVGEDLSVPEHNRWFVAGDLAGFRGADGKQLPGVAPVAIQQGRYIAASIGNDLNGKPRLPFRYNDKGHMATIGRSSAVAFTGNRTFTGSLAWLIWLVVHIWYLIGFKNRLFVIMSWTWSFLTFRRGARLILSKEWQSYPRTPT